jgi:diguanylate cyclase (GGDEF)-like protein
MVLGYLIIILEAVLYSALWLAAATGFADGVLVSFPFSEYLVPLPLYLLFTLGALFPSFAHQFIMQSPIRTPIAFTIAILTCAYFAIPSPRIIDGKELVRFPFLLYGAFSLFLCIHGRIGVWISSFILFAGAPITHIVFQEYRIYGSFLTAVPTIKSALASLLPILAAYGSTGIIASLAFRTHRRLQIENDDMLSPSPGSRSGGHEISETTTPAQAQPQKTSLFTAEYVSGLQGASDAEVEGLLNSVVYFMSRNFPAYSSLGFIYNPAQKVFALNSYQSKSLSILQGTEIGLGDGVVGRIGTEKHSFLSGDITLYNQQLQYYSQQEGINSIIAVPIISSSRELLGALVIDSKDKNAFKENHRDVLKRFSGLAAALITTARMRYFQEQTAARFKIFYEASQRFVTTVKRNDVLETLVDMASNLAPNTRIMAIGYSNDNTKASVAVVKGFSPDIQPGFEFPFNAGLYSFVFLKRKVVAIDDFQKYRSRYYRFFPEEHSTPTLRSLIILPILDNESRCLGLLSMEHTVPGQYQDETEQVLLTLTGNASIALIRAQLYHEMEKLATTDGLTGLTNHRSFQDQLGREIERARRYKMPLSLLMMDIDHFKSFNDTYGHPVGDLVLKEIANVITASLRINDIAARYGGEEMVVIVPSCDEKSVLIAAERIRKNIEIHTIDSMGRALKVTVSVGCATYPVHATDKQQLIDCTDKALYYSKENGRNRSTVYAKSMKGK